VEYGMHCVVRKQYLICVVEAKALAKTPTYYDK
jgi:hypothetical protein